MKQVNDPVLTGHDEGAWNCRECTDGFPKPCPECGGLLHGAIERIEGDGQVLVSECESCHGRRE